MATFSADLEGVPLHVEYNIPTGIKNGVEFVSIQVVDDKYRPIGPNLVLMFSIMLVLMREDDARQGFHLTMGRKALAVIGDEILCSLKNSPGKQTPTGP